MTQNYPTYKINHVLIFLFSFVLVFGMDYVFVDYLNDTKLFEIYQRSNEIFMIEVGIFIVGILLIFILAIKISKDRKVLNKLLILIPQYPEISLDNVQTIIDRIEEEPSIKKKSLSYYRTILNLTLYKNTKGVTNTFDDDKRFSEIMEKDLESSFEYIRYCIWVIPIFGFIGTLWGITKAVLGFSQVLKTIEVGSESKKLLNGLETISLELSSSFETTLPALIISALLAFLVSVLDRHTDRFILYLDKFQIDEIIKKLAVQIPSITTGTSTSTNTSNNDILIGLRQSLVKFLSELENNSSLIESNKKIIESQNTQLISLFKKNNANNEKLNEILESLKQNGIPVNFSVNNKNLEI